MGVRRVVPDVHAGSAEVLAAGRDFYRTLGLEEVMDLGWAVTLASPDNPTAQLTLSTQDASAPVVPDLSIEVSDVDAVYAAVLAAGAAEIVHPLQDEAWGVRRFFARDPTGRVVNILSHT